MRSQASRASSLKRTLIENDLSMNLNSGFEEGSDFPRDPKLLKRFEIGHIEFEFQYESKCGCQYDLEKLR